MEDYEAHLGSYDHSHRQRLKDMKAMVRDPEAAERARRQEARESGMVSLKVADGDNAPATAGGRGGGGSAGRAGFKKGGFKKAGFKELSSQPDNTPGWHEEPRHGDDPRDPRGGKHGDARSLYAERPAPPPPDPWGRARALEAEPAQGETARKALDKMELGESDTEDEGYRVYNPRFPTCYQSSVVKV